MRSSSTINEIILHCSDSDKDNSAKDINAWHKKKGWDEIGYHYVIRRNGTIEVGRPLHRIGAHCYGKNKHSIGICVIGKTYFNKVQFESLASLVEDLAIMFSITKVSHHSDYNKNKTCPNFARQEWEGLWGTKH